MRVVKALDVVEDSKPGLQLAAEAVPVDQFTLQRGKKALTQRVVITVTDRAHGGSDAGSLAAQPELDRRVLRPLVRVMDHPVGFTLLKCHLQGIGH